MAEAAREVVSAAKPTPSERLPAERIAAFVRDVVARSALNAWSFTADASRKGTAPTFTRAGKILFQILQREEAGPLVDLRAVETELAAHPELLPALAAVGTGAPEQPQASPAQAIGASASSALADVATDPAKMDMPESMTPTAFARWLGVDRRSIRRNLVQIPPGRPVPALPPGKIPARRIGSALRVLRADFLGEPGAVPFRVEVGGNTNGHHTKTPTGSAEGALHRQIADIRRRYAQRE
jgi:hypothetical protein